MKNKITVTGANIIFFIFVMLFMLFQVVLMIMSFIKGADFIDNNIYPILLVNQYVLILMPVLAFVVIKKLSIKEVFRFNNPGLIPLLIILLCSIPAYGVASFINTVVVYVLQFIGNIPAQPIPIPHSYSELLLGILIVAVSPAICEELLHRGILLSAYERRGSIKAVFITSIIFGLFHFDLTNLLGPIFLGLLIGYYVIRTNSIFAGMLAHFANNTIAEVLQYMSRNDTPAGDKITVQLNELGSIALYGVIGFLVLIILLSAFKRVTEGRIELVKPIAGIKDDIVSIVSHWPNVVVMVLYVLLGALYILSIILSKYSPGI